MSILSKLRRGTRPSMRKQLRETELANVELQRKMATAQLESAAFRRRAERAESRLADITDLGMGDLHEIPKLRERLARIVDACGALATVENQDALREIAAIAEGREDE